MKVKIIESENISDRKKEAYKVIGEFIKTQVDTKKAS